MKPVNRDPEWTAYILKLENVIRAIVRKYTQDRDLRKDCAQEARIGLLHTFPEKVKSYQKWKAGKISDAQWEKNLERYCRNVIRNRTLTYLTSLKTGPWDSGRAMKQSDGTVRHDPQRYAPLDMLIDGAGMQVDTDLNISFSDVYTMQDGMNAE